VNDHTQPAPPPTADTPSHIAGSTIDTPGGPPAVPGPAAPPGFILLEEVGRGGMGVVYRARDLAMRREVAVKILQDKYPPESPAADRFLEEACITGQLQHPGIPAVYQVGRLADGRPYLAMKLIRGRTLDRLLTDRTLDTPAVFEAIAQAVGYAHAQGVIHRDLKPANVMVGAHGEVQVMDWGLAKVLASRGSKPPIQPPVGPPSESPAAPTATGTGPAGADLVAGVLGGAGATAAGDRTRPGSVMGTPAYMPPEQARGETDRVDERSDVFGLGGLMAALLTGDPPFVAPSGESARQMAAAGRVEACFERLDGCGADPEVVALAKRCLAFNPNDRPADANAVAAAVAELRRAADDRARRAEQDRHATEVRAAEQTKRRRAVQRWAAAVALVFAAGAGASLWQAGVARKEARDADAARLDADAKRADADAARTAEAAKADEANRTVNFFAERVFAAARPKGEAGGLGKDVTLRDAIAASLPALGTEFAGQPLVEARLRETLGRTLARLGSHQEAAEQFERVRAVYAERHGPRHATTLSSAADLAGAYTALGRTADSLRLREEVVAGLRAARPDHPATLSAASGLGEAYAALGRHEDALRLRKVAADGFRRILPAADPSALQAANNLAGSYAALGRHEEARALNQEVLDARRRTLPPDHPDVLRSLNNLATDYIALGRRAEALKLREEVLDARRRVLPADHPEVYRGMSNLANSYADAGLHEDALRLHREAVAGFRRAFPPDHPDTLTAVTNLGGSYSDVGRHEDALKAHQEVLAARRGTLPADHPEILRSLRNVADSLVALGRGAEALPLLDECLAKAAGRPLPPWFLQSVFVLRLQHFRTANGPAGCRATAEMWEKLNRADAGSLYNAGCMRAVSAGLYAAAGRGDEAAADADRAVAWLTKAVAAGWRNRGHTESDPDLAFLRDRPDFRALAAALPYVAPPPRPKPKG
jgi:serine/threonine protein kinase